MITAALHGLCVAPPAGRRISELTAISAELAERVVELETARLGVGADLLFRLSELHRISPDAFRLTLELLRGNTKAATDSFTKLALPTGRPKQTTAHRLRVALALVRLQFPELCSAIAEIRQSGRNHEDPQSPADVLRGSRSPDSDE